MNKKEYLDKLTNAVRWRLSKSEADEVLGDYEEILSQRTGELDDLLIQELGEPLEAARLLTEPKAYRYWLAAFGLMAFCLLLPEFWLLRLSFEPHSDGVMTALFMVGLSFTLIWFWPCRKRYGDSPVPKGLLFLLAGLAVIAVVVAVVWADLVTGFATGVLRFLPPESYGVTVSRALRLVGTVATVAGLFGLVKAKISDYRWRALYVMGLAVLSGCVLVLSVLTSMDLSVSSFWFPYTAALGGIGLVGLIGVGVSLC